MKKPAKPSAKHKAAAKAATKKSAKKPAPKARAAAKTVDGGRRQGPEPAKGSVGTYTPQPIQGIGWAPFRYPLS